MPYTTNPHMPRVRRTAVQLIRAGWSTRQAARHFGYSQSAIVKWVARAPEDGRTPIPTRSSRPQRHPRVLALAVVHTILAHRRTHNRCAEVIHQELISEGVQVSLSSVKRTLDRHGLTRKRSPWKRYHPPSPRPTVVRVGDLVQLDTIHLMNSPTTRLYVYTLLDVYSRWAYAWAVPRISARQSAQFVHQAQHHAPFSFTCLQSDHGSEFSTHFSERIGIAHRHTRVRTPTDNGHLERFNRTLQEECLRTVRPQVRTINKALSDYLHYYNHERLHLGLNLKTPMQVIPSY